MANEMSNRDLVLNPGEYAYVQDQTKGQIKIHVGPTVVTQAGQDQPVVFEGGKFQRVRNLDEAVRRSPRAGEGEYLVLENPSSNGAKPTEGTVGNLPDLLHGRKVNIPGPCVFALWPGQVAKVIPAHVLRSNQFLQVRVYNEEEARKNWKTAILKRTGKSEKPENPDPKVDPKADPKAEAASVIGEAENLDLTIGSRYIIQGTDVSFYIPPTGVEVVPDGEKYVREAVTLERLEFAILVDEDGNKRYEKGPQVVFPKPTEEFWKDAENGRKFKAIELNTIQGLHVKVIAAYEEGGKKFAEGQELFITGKDTPIYYPRPEHSIITYGDRTKHYAVAVPAGEGRYVMDRQAGNIETVKGPCMLLPNPVTSVIVRRVLSDKQVNLWYPNNTEALAYNRNLRAMTANQDGALSGTMGYVPESTYASAALSVNFLADSDTRDTLDVPRSAGAQIAAKAARAVGEMNRGTKFTKPRELTLDTKYDGVPVIQVWTGYAVMVVNKTGKRRVIVGPATVLLDYDETLELLTLSTGNPKTTDRLLETVYLRVKNNKVSDTVYVQTSDHVLVEVKLSFRVNFEDEPVLWFDVENYVKFLSDHVRSMMKGAIRHFDIEKFYADGESIVRNIILGIKPEKGDRVGLKFIENGMRVVDVEVLEINIRHDNVRQMLEKAQYDAVAGNIQLAMAEKELKKRMRTEEIGQQLAVAVSTTAIRKLELQAFEIAETRKVSVAQEKAQEAALSTKKELTILSEGIEDLRSQSVLGRQKAENEQVIARMAKEQELRLADIKAESEAVVSKLGAAQGGFAEALTALSNKDTLVKIAEAMSIQRIIGGEDVAEIMSGIFKGTQLEGTLQRIMEMAAAKKLVP